jgi:ectoine hydroxylase-related dioxygenase (phytanoyl-CoA dioxygenase family)
MNTAAALEALGVSGSELTQDQWEMVDRDGYVVVPEVHSPATCAAMGEEFDRMVAIEGKRGGTEVHTEDGAMRISDTFNKSVAFDVTFRCPPVLTVAAKLLGDIKVHGANLREPDIGHGNQRLHTDTPTEVGGRWRVVNSLHLFDDMTADNGATRIVPGSHLWGPVSPPPANIDPSSGPFLDVNPDIVPEDPFAPDRREKIVEAPAGSVVIFNAHLWHAGTTRRSHARRRMMHLSLCRRDVPQQLVQRDYVTPGLLSRLGAADRWLLDVG